MCYFFHSLQLRDGPLFVFGCCNLLAAIVFTVLAMVGNARVRGANAWLKPLKFALSIAIFSFTMGWYTYELNAPGVVGLYNWAVIVLLGFEVAYIGLQAGRGQGSHYNVTAPAYAFLTALMAIAAALATLWTGYMGLLFFSPAIRPLPEYYVLSIRIGIFCFVFFAFQGATMGARSTHTVGGPEGEGGVPVLNWSTRYGDLRIAHFVGMHALQILPMLSWFVLRNNTATVVAGLLYALLAVFTLVRALKGKPLIHRKEKLDGDNKIMGSVQS